MHPAMVTPFSEVLASVAQRCLRIGKNKGFSLASSLDLAAQVLAVDCGLRPGFLYDYNAAGVGPIRSYMEAVQTAGLTRCHWHLLVLAGNILILNAERATAYLEAVLRENMFIVDVSAARSCPGMCDPQILDHIKRHIIDLLNHLKTIEKDSPEMISVSELSSVDWNLCTVFGMLLGFPASYWFSTDKGFENCLSLTPLRVFSVQASCPEISGSSRRFQLYSFSVPEALCVLMKEHLDAWSESLKHILEGQTSFQDLSIATETVSLAAVAL
uniref:UPF0739 protein C1orf74 homolog n=1 Tax=Geotrypetes seraphini TaxID=260995 RepID=A0A6P8PDH8_GEOSA|nr:UPF0739 protein C1orf74 homolog [Geotrypetes seraphini]XP_033773615.1 UPF0739 protein C1orf74 homolog [Geotrypetes seraphini]XP_033773616.1 UPF0739 protein C1orf74 homolog [Geotrypetes seraphini]